MTVVEAIEKARSYFLTEDHVYGCAETAFLVLQEAFDLSNAPDSALAMALNGGVAWSGGVCGAITGAALAFGWLAGQRVADHKEAKRVARRIMARYTEEFCRQWGAVDCRTLIGQEIRTDEQHTAFIKSGLWQDVCMRQIEFAVRKLLPLRDEEVWQRNLGAAGQGA